MQRKKQRKREAVSFVAESVTITIAGTPIELCRATALRLEPEPQEKDARPASPAFEWPSGVVWRKFEPQEDA